MCINDFYVTAFRLKCLIALIYPMHLEMLYREVKFKIQDYRKKETIIYQQFVKLPGSLQHIPQYIEVPPNIEAKQIVSYFSTVLSY